MQGQSGVLQGACVPVSALILKKKFQDQTIYGLDKPKLTMLGVVRQMDVQPTSVEFWLDDSSGVLKVEYFCEDWEYSEGDYLRIYGEYRGNDEKFVAYNVRSLSTMNEVTHHILSCSFAQKMYSGGEAGGMMKQSMEFGNSMQIDQTGNSEWDSITCGEQIANAMKTAVSEDGMSIDAIISLCSGADPMNIKKGVGEMMEAGLIYTTVDEDHFALADS